MEHSKPEELINILAVLAFAPTANGEGLMLVTDTQHGPLNLALSVDTVRQVLRRFQASRTGLATDPITTPIRIRASARSTGRLQRKRPLGEPGGRYNSKWCHI